MALTSEQVLGLVTKIENATDADKRLAAIQVLEATLDGATEIPDVDAVIQVLKVSLRNANQAVSAAALAYLPSLFISLAAPTIAHGRILPSSVAHVRAGINHLMPVLIEKLGDQKERVREAARKALTQLGSSAFIVSPPTDATAGARKGKELETPLMIYERLMRDNALGAKAARIKEQATQVLPALKLATQDRFPIRLLLPSLVTLLSDADPSVREGSRAALIGLFVNATPAAKAGLKKELERQDVRKATMDAIVKEVLAGPSAIPQAVAPSASSAGIGPAPTTSAQMAVTQAAAGGGVPGAAALGAGEDDVPPVYVASRSDLDRTFSQMLPFFEGKESEENWLSREQSILKIRGLLKTGTHVTYRTAFVDGIKHVHEAILKALVSLRTTVSIHTCSLLGELARAIGDSMDSLADTFMNSLLRMAGMTKKMVAASTQAAAREFFIHVPFKHATATLLSVTMNEKTATSRQAAIEHICTLLQYQGSSKRHAMESHGSQNLLLQALKRALADQNKDVRAKARETFWVFHAIWPAQASAILEAADGASKKAILASVPPPGTVLLLTADKSSGNGAAAHSVSPAVAAAAHQQLAASAPSKKPSFTQSIGPGASSQISAGMAPKSRPVASVASSIASTASAPVEPAAPASAAAAAPVKRRAIGPSAALLAAKREAKLKMRASEAAEREQEQARAGAKSSTASAQGDGDDSDGGDDWMADFKAAPAVKPLSSSSRAAFMPARPRTPPSASASISSIKAPAASPPRFVPKYGHDAILASPPKPVSHVRSFSHKSIEDASPTKIPLPVSPTSPRRSDSPRLMSSPQMGGLSGLGIENTRLPRPSTDLLSLANDDDADATQLLSMPGPDASIDLMMFSSSSPAGTPAAKARKAGPGPSTLSQEADADNTTTLEIPDVEEDLEPAMSSMTISGNDGAGTVEDADASMTNGDPEGTDESGGTEILEPQQGEPAGDGTSSDVSDGRDVEETVALQAHEATSTAAQLLNLLETPVAAAAAAAAAAGDSEATPRIGYRSREGTASPDVSIRSPERSHASYVARGAGNTSATNIVSPPSSVGSRSRAGTPTSAQRRSHLPRPVSMLHRGSSPLHTLGGAGGAAGRHSSTRSVDLNAVGPDAALSRLSGAGGRGEQPHSHAYVGDSRRSSVSSTASSQVIGGGGQRSMGSRPVSSQSRAGYVTSPPLGPGPQRATFDARPMNPSGQSAAVSSFLRRASRLEQGSPIKSKPEAAEWVAAIRDGTADLRTYKRLLKLTIDFRINSAAGSGGELVPGRDGGSRFGSGSGAGALGLERMGDAEFDEEEAGMRAWEEGNLFEDLFIAICGSLQAPAKIEELRTACFALLHRLVENQFPLFTSTGRELDLLALLFQLRKDGRKGKQTLDASEAILISWSSRTDPMLGLAAVVNNLKATADEIGAGGPNGNGNGNGAEQPTPTGDESTLRTLVMGLRVLGRLLLRLPGEVIEEELSRATHVLRMTLTHSNVELRRTAIETLVAANRQINNAETLFKLVGPLPTSQQDLLMYYFHKAGQQ
ncbi:suppressor of tub2 mutation [Tilletia horrida]|nr:suppressor of tub2 mutation [Tilletia horrida]